MKCSCIFAIHIFVKVYFFFQMLSTNMNVLKNLAFKSYIIKRVYECVYIHMRDFYIQTNYVCTHRVLSVGFACIVASSLSCTHRFDTFCQNHMNENQMRKKELLFQYGPNVCVSINYICCFFLFQFTMKFAKL